MDKKKVFMSMDQLASIDEDLASISRTSDKDIMTMDKCINESLVADQEIGKGNDLYLFALSFFGVLKNRKSFCAAKNEAPEVDHFSAIVIR